MKLTRLHRGYAYIGWWSNGGRKPHKMTIDHTYNRLKDSMMQVSVVEWSNFFEN